MNGYNGSRMPGDWQRQNTGGQDSQGYRPYKIGPAGQTGTGAPARRKRRPVRQQQQGSFWMSAGQERVRRHMSRVPLALLLIVVAAALFSYLVVFRVRHIYVDGNRTLTEQQVTALSGVRLKSSILDVNEEKVAASVQRDSRLIFLRLEKTWNAVTIFVRERTPAAVVQHSGIRYQIDREGMVLEDSENPKSFSDLPEVTGIGLNGRNAARTGAKLSVSDPRQLTVLDELLLEIKIHSAERIVTGIKLSNLSDILLETADGFSVRLGDSSHLRGKIKALLLVREELLRRESGSGTIDVSAYTDPTFIREN